MRDDSGGFTVVELVVVSSLMLVVMMAAWFAMEAVTASYNATSATIELSSDTQSILDLMSREVRQGQEIMDGDGVLATATPTVCCFYSDIDGCGRPERVTYSVTGTTLYREVDPAQREAYPWDFQPGPRTPVLEGLTNPDAVFSYYPPSGESTVSTVDTISMIGVRLAAGKKVGRSTAHVDESTRMKIRAVFNSLQ